MYFFASAARFARSGYQGAECCGRFHHRSRFLLGVIARREGHTGYELKS